MRLIPEDFRIEVVCVHYRSTDETEYEVQLRWTPPDGHGEVVPLAWRENENEAKALARQAKLELKEIVNQWI